MKCNIDGLEVIFPYAGLYPEQQAYMHDLKKALDVGGHALLEMPSGTGKTITILSLISAYLLRSRNEATRKLVYCTRTVEEMQKVLEEMRVLVKAWEAEAGSCPLLGVCLASRRHLCIHPTVGNKAEGVDVDSACRSLTAPWVRERLRANSSAVEQSGSVPDPSLPLCGYFEKFEAKGNTVLSEEQFLNQGGIFDLSDLRDKGRQIGVCPYFLARRLLNVANIVVYSYHYLLDPKVAGIVSRDLTRDAIVVFDEAHNTDNICIESMSTEITLKSLGAASSSVSQLNGLILKSKQQDSERLNAEYRRLMDGLNLASLQASAGPDGGPASQILIPDSVLQETTPREIRKAEDFVECLRGIVGCLKARLRQAEAVTQESHGRWVASLLRETNRVDDIRSLRFASDRLTSLLRTLQVADWGKYRALQQVANMVSLASTYTRGFAVIVEPFDDFTGQRDPKLQLACLDASLAIKPVFDKFRTVVLTSGTLSPLDTYPRMLQFRAAIASRFPMSLERPCVCPLIVTSSDSQEPLSTKFSDRANPAMARGFGEVLLGFVDVVPDGVVVFFPSYLYMGEIVSLWSKTNVLAQLQQRKLLYVETQDPKEASVAILNYRRACDSGRGGLLLSVARGRAAEGIDLDHHHGRCVILFGVPFQYTESRILRARLEFLRQECQIKEDDFLVFDAMRQAAQCVGRVIRNKRDYGIMVFADKRFQRTVLRSKLPKWINQFISADALSLDTTTAVTIARNFLLTLAQPAPMAPI